MSTNLHLVTYNDITNLEADIKAAPAGDIHVVMPAECTAFQASFIGVSLYSKHIEGIQIMDDLIILEGRYAIVVKKA